MNDDKTKKEKAIERNKRLFRIAMMAKEHKETQEKMQVSKGGYTDSSEADKELETLKTSWKDRTDDMRHRLRSRKEKAKAMWRGR